MSQSLSSELSLQSILPSHLGRAVRGEGGEREAVPELHGDTGPVRSAGELLVRAGAEGDVGGVVWSVAAVLGVVVDVPDLDPQQEALPAGPDHGLEVRADLAAHPPLRPALIEPGHSLTSRPLTLNYHLIRVDSLP